MSVPPVDLDTQFERAWSKVVECFPDACLMVRTKDGMKWRFTNAEWAFGASETMRDTVMESLAKRDE